MLAIHTLTHTHTHVHTFTYPHAFLYTHTHTTHSLMLTHTKLHTHTHPHTHTHTHTHAHAYILTYSLTHILSVSVHNFLCTLPRSAAPHIPRVLLLGPTGSGKSLQAAQLTRQYRLVNVDCKELIKQTLASGSKLAVQMKPFHERGLLSEL